MALLTGYSDDNKHVNWTAAPVSNKTLIWLNGFGWAWNVETVTRQSYEYVGMTSAAADTCSTAMVALWTVTLTNYYVDGNGQLASNTVDLCVADVRKVWVGGSMYKVTVDVNKVENTVSATA